MKCAQNGALAILAVVLMAGVIIFVNREPAGAQSVSAGHPHYTVVETQGHNLLVTDNAKNMIYFYTVDKDQPIGSDLKLRAAVDLTQVGKNEIKITKTK